MLHCIVSWQQSCSYGQSTLLWLWYASFCAPLCCNTVNGQALPFTVNCLMQYSGPDMPGDTCENIFPQYHRVELLELLSHLSFAIHRVQTLYITKWMAVKHM